MARKFALTVAFIALVSLLWFTTALDDKQNFLWHITSPDGNGEKSYIMGSIHLAYPGLYPLEKPFMEAFEKSQALVVEINVDDLPPGTVTQYIKNHGLAPAQDPRPLLERLKPDTARLLIESGFYNENMARFKPWLAALNIQLQVMTQQGFEAQYGLDKYFMDMAKRQGHPIIALETLGQQMESLSSMSEAESDLFLRSAILEMEALPQIMNDFLETWGNGDVPKFSRIFFKEYDKYPELQPLFQKIIVDRNHTMAAEIILLLDSDSSTKTYFIVVGAGHLVGEENILTLLEDHGYILTQQ